jgi:GNAT superfamily N-acetyltransferase
MQIISNGIKNEYETATDYINDPDATHFYMIEDSVLVCYFHIVFNREHKYYINYVYTNPKYRGKGLMKTLLQYAMDVSPHIEELYTWTKNTNQASQQLFISSGFQVISRDDTDVVLMKRLHHHTR